MTTRQLIARRFFVVGIAVNSAAIIAAVSAFVTLAVTR